MNDEACPDCGGPLTFLEKDTSSGREFREYLCKECDKVVTLGGDVALWKILHDSNEELRARQAAGNGPLPAPKPWWKFWG